MTIIVRKGNMIGCDSAHVKSICGEQVMVYDRPKIFLHETKTAIIAVTGAINSLGFFNAVLKDINQIILDMQQFPNIAIDAPNTKEFVKENKISADSSNTFSVLIATKDLSVILERREDLNIEIHEPKNLIAIGSGSIGVLTNYNVLNKPEVSINEVIETGIYFESECGGDIYTFDLDNLLELNLS